ncbi:MAG: 4-hydroxy-tetrahydrodipicolinate synthase [Myxococcota bacterium]|nr:4-hydroxy-tetrahydrodipicolinate synthase [Myxococcota bacterium]
MENKLKGVFTALVTPFKDGDIDLETFEALCKRQLEAGISGLVPCGTTGETPSLTDGEWEKLISTAVRFADKRVPVIAGCGSNNTQTTIRNVQKVKAMGADAGLVVFPYYNKPNPKGLKKHVEAVCDQGLPIVLYHVPGRTGQRLPASLLETLCRTPGVIGLKEATGDLMLGQELLNRLSDTNVSLLSGDDFSFAAMVAMGFDGVISVLSNPAPQQSVAWFEAAYNGDMPTLRQLRYELLPVVDALFSSTNPIPCKGMMHAMGLLRNECRLPLEAEHPPATEFWENLS